LRRKANGQREIHLAFVDAGNFLSADGGLNHGIHVGDSDAVASSFGTVHLDHQIRLAKQTERARVGNAGDLRKLFLDRFRQTLELAKVAPEDFD
jgi:hypothetical protein